MTEREAFLRKLVEQPGDDTHRLVFADWLDEHAESERASHLRRPGAWFIISASLRF